MSVAKAKTKKIRRVNKTQPVEILKEKQKARLRALMAEEKRAEEMRRQFEAFLAGQAVSNNNNNNNNNSPGSVIASIHATMKKGSKRKTRRLRR
jgi:hypothetical protein